MTTSGKVWLVGAGPGDPDLITVRGRELLGRVGVVVYDECTAPQLLEGCRRDAERVCVSEGDAASPEAEARLTRRVLEWARQGREVVRLFAEELRSLSRVLEQAEALARENVRIGVVPGVAWGNGLDAGDASSGHSASGVGDASSVRARLLACAKGPLFGKRLLLPRPREQASASAREVRERGAVPIVMPLLSIEDPDDVAAVTRAVAELHSYDWVILTSANGAERLVMAIRAMGRDARAFGRAKIAVIGPKTAVPLEQLGIVVDLIAEEHVAEGLLLGLASQEQMKNVLVFRASEAREILPSTLRARGARVDVVAAYRTRRVTGAAAEPLRTELVEGRVDAVLVTSSSMAQALGDALGADAPELLRNTAVASIGPVTTQSLESLGIRPSVVAARYTVEGLLDALEAAFAEAAFAEGAPPRAC